MPAFLAPLLGWFVGYLVSSIIVRLFVSTGLSVVSLIFVNDLVDQSKAAVANALYGLPADALSLLQLWKITDGLSIIFSAYTVAAYIKTVKVIIGKN
ncbi:DUF2523 family protein [Acinetobacter haemolyticus]|uniref:DUF2523 family protein n=1 Tax=Acinetobacter haemolyticus TaxID=29430 RepID=UPI0021CDC791|nr:DUF2523 family protein [Acinetobacter haemolyticus]MCU4380021.1 DUF2523 domain-containing protein [Acinetobacter haemolyticus]